jgi:hypothetical protein
MRLLGCNSTSEFSLTKDFVGDDGIPPYAILSHTWKEDQEVTFKDLMDGTGKSKAGYDKIRFCGQQAKRDGLQYFWVDTCCIDKSNNVELQEAINSMFRWYQNAAKCYVYLSDVSTAKRKASDRFSEFTWEPAFQESRWFTRGWTLQELLAPGSVEFFSREGKQLGDKRTLERQIHEITGIPIPALRLTPLSQFGVEERLSWAENRQTTRKEDKAYSLLGIFDVFMPLIYGEGRDNAFKRLWEEIDKPSKGRLQRQAIVQAMKEDQECIQHLRLTDPRDDKKRIEETKGGLLEHSYHWILEHSDFQQWRNGQQGQLLWIKGDPGKGKTMLLCGIINELKKMAKTELLSYFFCQATDSRINNAKAVLRGLVYLLVDQQPSLVSHIRKKHDHAGKTLFEDANAWVALSEIFTNILQDPSLNSTYLIIDALDECVTDLPKLLDFVVQKSSVSPHVKWIVSSRNWPSIEKDLAAQKVRLCLELNEKSVSAAVTTFIQVKVDWLAKRNRYDNDTRDAVQRYLSLNANGTFLWVALVCQELANISRWKAQKKLTAFPPGLDALYRRMMDQIWNSEDAKLCKHILAVVSAVYRPVTLDELASFVDMPDGVSGDYEALSEIIGLCGSFLTLRERTISFVHQSVKDFILKEASYEIFPSGREETHYVIFSRSLQVMSRTLRRDIYSLRALGYPIERVELPEPDPLAASRYSCIHWVDHFCDWNTDRIDQQDGGAIDEFVRKKYLYWLEALSLCRSMSDGVISMAKLEALIQVILESVMLSIIHADID